MSSLPTEIAALLCEGEGAASYERVSAGIDSFLGETYLVVDSGRLRVWSRGSALDPLAELGDVSSARIESGRSGAELALVRGAAEFKVRLGYAEKDRVAALLERLPGAGRSPPVRGPSPESGALPAESPEDEPPKEEQPALQAELDPWPPGRSDVGEELDALRKRLLGVMRGATARASGRVAMLAALSARQAARSGAQPLWGARIGHERDGGEQPKEPGSQAIHVAEARLRRKLERRRDPSREKARPTKPVSLSADLGQAWMPPVAPLGRAKRSGVRRAALLLIVITVLWLAYALAPLVRGAMSP